MKTEHYSCPITERVVILRFVAHLVSNMGSSHYKQSIDCECSAENECIHSYDVQCRRRQISDGR